MNNEETVEALVKAREVLWEKGWTQHGYTDGGGRVCSVGAVAVACGIPIVSKDTLPGKGLGSPILAGPLEALEEVAEMWVPHWNDKPGRTFADVIDLFDAAIKSLESE